MYSMQMYHFNIIIKKKSAIFCNKWVLLEILGHKICTRTKIGRHLLNHNYFNSRHIYRVVCFSSGLKVLKVFSKLNKTNFGQIVRFLFLNGKLSEEIKVKVDAVNKDCAHVLGRVLVGVVNLIPLTISTEFYL